MRREEKRREEQQVIVASNKRTNDLTAYLFFFFCIISTEYGIADGLRNIQYVRTLVGAAQRALPTQCRHRRIPLAPVVCVYCVAVGGVHRLG